MYFHLSSTNVASVSVASFIGYQYICLQAGCVVY